MLPKDIIKHPLKNLPKFVDQISAFGSGRIYRGQANSSWPLLPKAGRSEFLRPRGIRGSSVPLYPDLQDFEKWKGNAVAFCERLPEKPLECLAYAQHYGLATRLLDWTDNPLVALFFAVDSQPEEEGIIYCYYPGQAVAPENFDPAVDPLDHLGILLYRPRPFDRRIQAQQGVFTYHSPPESKFVVSEPLHLVPAGGKRAKIPPWMVPLRTLTAFPIPAKNKQTMMIQLKDLGVTRKALFPDLEGLSSYINWEARIQMQK